MSTKEEILAKYKDYKPDVHEYDENEDGGEMMVREKQHDQKDELRKKFEERMKKMSSGRTAR